MQSSLRVRMALKLRVLGWMGTILFAFLSVWQFVDGDIGMAGFFLAMGCAGIYVLIYSYQAIEITPHSITLRTMLNQYRMPWAEVDHIEFDRSNWSLVLEGNNQRLALPGTAVWRMGEKYPVMEAFLALIERNNIELRASATASFKLSHHTKVR